MHALHRVALERLFRYIGYCYLPGCNARVVGAIHLLCQGHLIFRFVPIVCFRVTDLLLRSSLWPLSFFAPPPRSFSPHYLSQHFARHPRHRLRTIARLAAAQSGFPYVAVFLRKEPEWNQGAEADGEASGEAAAAATGPSGDASTTLEDNKDGVVEGAAENAVQQTFPEVITSIDEIHGVGTLAQASAF